MSKYKKIRRLSSASRNAKFEPLDFFKREISFQRPAPLSESISRRNGGGEGLEQRKTQDAHDDLRFRSYKSSESTANPNQGTVIVYSAKREFPRRAEPSEYRDAIPAASRLTTIAKLDRISGVVSVVAVARLPPSPLLISTQRIATKAVSFIETVASIRDGRGMVLGAAWTGSRKSSLE
ncbi:hypothetical protein K0M31_011960 [Melipona bicolor]|uniref:Uncharacterized protein n=1 Tax=Melipona bicolor TaxID=60889 RepID=A0AA40KVI2_9HYME|nr:hypothetical protein K0M31_011960 [Melipona bicolor]